MVRTIRERGQANINGFRFLRTFFQKIDTGKIRFGFQAFQRTQTIGGMLPAVFPLVKHLLLGANRHGRIHHPRISRGIHVDIIELLAQALHIPFGVFNRTAGFFLSLANFFNDLLQMMLFVLLD